MEIPNEEEEEVEEMPMPLNSTYSGVHSHMIHHQNINHIIIPSSNIDQINTTNSPPNGPILFENPKKPVFKYKECLKNHAASMGGHATDGCGEFMPSGEENALTCSACNCHRNFHRKEIENGDHINQRLIISRSFHNKGFHHNHHPLIVPPHHMIMSCNNMDGSDQSDDQMKMKMKMKMKKRFRTKFSQEQKEKMLQFAEKVGWKIQKQEESVVQQFCEEIGVKRRVLKVWMHNNKHILANKNNIQSNPIY